MSDEPHKLPLYVQIKNKMVENIKNNIWRAGNPIPSESQMMQTYNVSRTTIRQAISDLVQVGILETQRGKATHVKQVPREEMSSSGVVHHELDGDFSVKVLRSGYMKERYFAKKQLNLPEDDEVFFLERLRLSKGIPIGFQQLETPSFMGEIIQDSAATNFDLFPVFGEHNIYYINIKENVSATNATQYEADILGVVSGEALIDIERITLGIDHIPIEYCRTKYLPVYFKYKVEIGR